MGFEKGMTALQSDSIAAKKSNNSKANNAKAASGKDIAEFLELGSGTQPSTKINYKSKSNTKYVKQ